MKMLPVIVFLVGLSCGGCAKGLDRCPSTSSEVISSLKEGGFTGSFDADIQLMGEGSEYCFFRYEYLFGQSGRMSSRLVVFSRDRYLGSYAFSFDSLKVEGDRILVVLPSGAKQSILLRDVGSMLLIDGEPLTFYK